MGFNRYQTENLDFFMSKIKGSSSVYCVGRNELLSWVNELLELNYSKVEDTANGAAFCQIIDCVHPGTVALSRVNYDAMSEPEMLNNYKILQDAFDKNGITQHIDVATLTRGKYMAALEMFQWMHGYYRQKVTSQDYDASLARKKAKCKEPRLSSSGQRTAPQKPAAPIAKMKVRAPMKTEPKPEPIHKALPSRESVPTPKDLPKKVRTLELEVTQMTQERDFYYNKLRRVEDFCQDKEDNPIIKQILGILYEGDAENGFMQPDEYD